MNLVVSGHSDSTNLMIKIDTKCRNNYFITDRNLNKGYQ